MVEIDRFLVKIDRIWWFFLLLCIHSLLIIIIYIIILSNFQIFSQFLAVKFTFFVQKSQNRLFLIPEFYRKATVQATFFNPFFSVFFLSDLGWFREPDLGDTNVAHLYNIRSSLSRRLTARGARESRMSLISINRGRDEKWEKELLESLPISNTWHISIPYHL